ncbi:MAG TPA: hypothetical protein VGW34_03615 [Allosphingosinicella sp.]|nr:hypothetical protein [Allosphingosinicella sp.]
MLKVPFDRLPEDAAERHGALRDYFCDKDAEAVRNGDGWELKLAWPGGEERHVDPKLEEGLSLWGGIELNQMAMAQRRSGRVLRALYDTWTLHSWSEWFAGANIASGETLTILHIDDHRDLGSPRLFQMGWQWVDPITGQVFDFDDPASVRSAIESGAVGMGSFLTPVLHRFPEADVRQLGQAPKVTGTTDYRVELTTEADNLLEPGAERPAVRLQKGVEGTGPGHYRITDDPQRWVEDVRPGPVLLHVDMDYFNNRYDGDGDWRERAEVLDPAVNQVLAEVDRVTATLRGAGVVSRIGDAVIAFSPGFFPAELWEPADRKLQEGLEELYG